MVHHHWHLPASLARHTGGLRCYGTLAQPEGKEGGGGVVGVPPCQEGISGRSKPCMAQLTVLQEGLFIGAAVTQASLIDYLLEASSAAHKKHKPEINGADGRLEGPQGGMPGVYTVLAHHLQRIAGNPVSPAVH